VRYCSPRISPSRSAAIPGALGRRGLDPQDLARPFDVGRTRRGQGGEARRLALVEAREIGPDPGILAAEPPERDSGDPFDMGGAQFVPGAGRVEEPDMVGLAVLLLVIEGGIAADRIEARHRLALARGQPRLLDGERLGGLTLDPIVAVIGDGRDRLVGADRAHRLLQAPHIPALRSDRAGIALAPMLVVEHQEHLIDDMGISGEVPVGIADRRRHRDAPAARVEAAVGQAEEAQIVALCGQRDLLEVEDDAGPVPRRHHRLEPVEQLGAGPRVVQHGGEAGPVPMVVAGVLDHRKDERPALGPGDDRVEGGIGLDVELVLRPGQEGGGRDHPVDLVDMGGERGAAGLVPGHVEAAHHLAAGGAAAGGGGQPAAAEHRPRRAAPRAGDPIHQPVPRLLHPQRQRGWRRHLDDGEGEHCGGRQDEQDQSGQRTSRPPSAAPRRIQKNRLYHCREFPARGAPIDARLAEG
jgi:hypothetical protein